MNVVTFYSFKGGVGRTFALVNVAAELAQSGRRVLAVDFDLEAPGIGTFELLSPPAPHAGVVEFVCEYERSNASPDVRDFCYLAEGVGRDGGRLWIMPAGKGDDSYRRSLASINWRSLYDEHHGYLMIEDMKEQWRGAFAPDYVLIDSRTGFSDVHGICTRQLPDAVVILFVPNRQNLNGLRHVVREIRKEQDGVRRRSIQLLFVASNVPDLDDEEEILKERRREFKTQLEYRELAAVVHSYPSLSLLDQAIFTRSRPMSRLAKEYLRLKDAIVEQNVHDRQGAIRFLKRNHNRFGIEWRSNTADLNNKLSTILSSHSRDGEVLALAAMIKEEQGQLKEAVSLFDDAIAFGYRPADVYLERAACRLQLGSDGTARVLEDLFAALNSPDMTSMQVERAIRQIGAHDESALANVVTTRAVESLGWEGRLFVARTLMSFDLGVGAAVAVLDSLARDTSITVAQQSQAKAELSLCLIGSGQFQRALEVLRALESDSKEAYIAHVFNHAMALWGHTGIAPHEWFSRVVSADIGRRESRREDYDANYYQCLAVAYWAVGEIKVASDLLTRAIERLRQSAVSAFSCWRYRYSSNSEFVSDCEGVSRLLAGEPIVPRFMAVRQKVFDDLRRDRSAE